MLHSRAWTIEPTVLVQSYGKSNIQRHLESRFTMCNNDLDTTRIQFFPHRWSVCHFPVPYIFKIAKPQSSLNNNQCVRYLLIAVYTQNTICNRQFTISMNFYPLIVVNYIMSRERHGRHAQGHSIGVPLPIITKLGSIINDGARIYGTTVESI